MAEPSLRQLVERPGRVLVTSDLFDTVLLRDGSTETERLSQAAGRAAGVLGVDAVTVRGLRWAVHDAAYRALAVERPAGDARLSRMAEVMAGALGLPTAASVLVDAEVQTDIRHLRPNRDLLRLLGGLRAAGTRVVAVSDTYYSSADLRVILEAVVGEVPFDEVYSSADLDATKHAGSIFDLVAAREGFDPAEIVHVGDSALADVEQPGRAGWTTVHSPREASHRWVKAVGRLSSAPQMLRRDW